MAYIVRNFILSKSTTVYITYLINIFTTQNYLSRKKYMYSRFLLKISIFHFNSISIKISFFFSFLLNLISKFNFPLLSNFQNYHNECYLKYIFI